jgi:hypothetical protein
MDTRSSVSMVPCVMRLHSKVFVSFILLNTRSTSGVEGCIVL